MSLTWQFYPKHESEDYLCSHCYKFLWNVFDVLAYPIVSPLAENVFFARFLRLKCISLLHICISSIILVACLVFKQQFNIIATHFERAIY